MIITEKLLPSIFKGKPLEELRTIYIENKNIVKISLKTISFDNIIFLSLKSNNIKDIEFLSFFKNLWYLDIRENPVTNN